MSPSRSFRLPAICFFFCLELSQAQAQLEVRLEPEARTFVAHSPVYVKVILINRSAQALALTGPSATAGWLNFRVTNHKGDLVTPRPGAPLPSPLKIGASKTVSLKVNLNRAYPVDRFGNYQITANVYDPSIADFVSSTPAMITIDEAKPIWNQTAGLPDGNRHQFSLLSYRGYDRTYLYFRLTNAKTGFVRKTYQLGEMVRYRPPQAAIDEKRHFHVLYQAAPRQYVHDHIGSDGKFIKRTTYDESKGSRPELVQGRDGYVRVEGGEDPELKNKERNEKLKELTRIRLLSDRPPGF